MFGIIVFAMVLMAVPGMAEADQTPTLSGAPAADLSKIIRSVAENQQNQEGNPFPCPDRDISSIMLPGQEGNEPQSYHLQQQMAATLNVLSITPQDDRREVDPLAEISATFSLPLDETTVNRDNVILESTSLNYTLTAYAVLYDKSKCKITVELYDALRNSASYRVTLKSALRDTDGHTLGTDYSWTFTTKRDPTVSIFDDYRNCLVMAGRGNRLAWLQDTGQGYYQIYGADLIEGRAKNISLIKDGLITENVQLAVYDRTVVWSVEGDRGWDLTSYNLDTTQESSIVQALPQEPSPDIWGDNIVYTDYSQGQGDIWLYNTGDGNKLAVCDNSEEQSKPRISERYVVWEDNRNGNADIYAYDLLQKIEIAVITSTSVQSDPDIWENIVVWHDDELLGCGIYYADMEKGINSQKLIYDVNFFRVKPKIYENRVSWKLAITENITYDGIYVGEIGGDEVSAVYVGTKSHGQYFFNHDYFILMDDQFHDIYSIKTNQAVTDPLETLNVYPKPGTRGIRVEEPVVINFSRPVDSATVNRDSFFLTDPGGTKVDAEISFYSDIGSYLLKPVSNLAEGTEYTVNLTEAINDLQGNSLVPRSWNFTTATHDAIPLTIETNVRSSYPTAFDQNWLYLVNHQMLYRDDAESGLPVLLYQSPLLTLGYSNFGIDYPPHCYGNKVVISTYNPDNTSYDVVMLNALNGNEFTELSTDLTHEVYPYIFGERAAWLQMDSNSDLDKPAKLVIKDFDTGLQTMLAQQVFPYWFPGMADNLICWSGNENGRYQLHVKDLESGTLFVDDTGRAQGYPFIWKDRIVWAEVTDQGTELWYGKIDSEGIKERQAIVKSADCKCSHPFIYGNNIVWNEKNNEEWHIYCYNLVKGERQTVVDQAGNQVLWGIYGNQVVWVQDSHAFLTMLNDSAPDLSAPSVPTKLNGTVNEVGQMALSWDRSSDDLEVTGYRLERSDDGENWSSLGVWYDYGINDEQISCQDMAPPLARSWSYRVAAYDAAGNCSDWSLLCQVQKENLPQLTILSGNNQSQTPGQHLQEPLELCLTDSFGQALSGVEVTLATESGQASFDPINQTTDENGLTQFQVSIETAGKVQLTASCPELESAKAAITLYGMEPTCSLTAVTGQGQSGLMGELLTQPCVVLLRDADDLQITDCAVSFQVKSGSAKLLVEGSDQSSEQEVRLVTAADGTVSLRVVPGYGDNIITASVEGLDQTVDFECQGSSESMIVGNISNYSELYANHGYWDLEVYSTDELGNQGPETIVDSQGNFRIPVCTGVWTVGLKPVTDIGQAIPMAYPIPCQLLVEEGENLLSLSLIPAPVRVTGRVTDEQGKPFLLDSGNPMLVEVWASSLNHPLGPVVTPRRSTDAQGNFELYLPTGQFTLGCWVQGHILPPDRSIEVTAQGLTEELWLKVPRGKNTICGNTYTGNNKLSGVLVTAWSSEHGLAFDYSGTGSGFYYVTVPSGTYEMRAFHPEKGELEMNPASIDRLIEITEPMQVVNFKVNQSTGLVTGRLYYQDETEQAVAGAMINAFNPVSRVRNSTCTNELGEYRLELPVSTEPYTIEVWHRDQGKAAEMQISLPIAGAVVNQDLGIPAAVVLSGKVYRNGQSVSGANISAWCVTDNNYISCKSDPQGSYRLNLKPGENYRLSVWSQGDGEQSVEITAVPDMTHDFELTGLTAVRGRVEMGSSGQPVAYAWVQFLAGSGKSFGVFTQEDGSFELQIPQGQYTLLANKKGLVQKIVAAFEVGESLVDTGSIIMSNARVAVNGIVGDSGNNPLAFAMIWAQSSLGDVVGTRSDVDGSYSLALYQGSWTLTAVHDNWQKIHKAINVVEGSNENNLAFIQAQVLDAPGLAQLKTELGGLIQDQQNGMELLLPPGSTASESELSVVTARNDAAMPSSSQQPLVSYDFSAFTSDGGAFKGILDQSMEARIRYYRSDLDAAGIEDNSATESKLSLAYYDEAAADWVAVPSIQDTYDPDEQGGGIFVVRSDHFTQFSIVQPSTLVMLGMRSDSSNSGGSGGGGSTTSPASQTVNTVNQSAVVDKTTISTNQPTGADTISIFDDTRDHWAANSIAKMVQRGVIKGYDGKAYPDRPVNRAELFAFLSRLLQLPLVELDLPFTDVEENSWYYGSIQSLYGQNLLVGVDQDLMAPDATMTREQVATVLGRVVNTLSETQPDNNQETRYIDEENISSWSREAIHQLTAVGVFSGYPDGSFRPASPISRAESMVCLERMLAILPSGMVDKHTRTGAEETAVLKVEGFPELEFNQWYEKDRDNVTNLVRNGQNAQQSLPETVQRQWNNINAALIREQEQSYLDAECGFRIFGPESSGKIHVLTLARLYRERVLLALQNGETLPLDYPALLAGSPAFPIKNMARAAIAAYPTIEKAVQTIKATELDRSALSGLTIYLLPYQILGLNSENDPVTGWHSGRFPGRDEIIAVGSVNAADTGQPGLETTLTHELGHYIHSQFLGSYHDNPTAWHSFLELSGQSNYVDNGNWKQLSTENFAEYFRLVFGSTTARAWPFQGSYPSPALEDRANLFRQLIQDNMPREQRGVWDYNDIYLSFQDSSGHTLTQALGPKYPGNTCVLSAGSTLSLTAGLVEMPDTGLQPALVFYPEGKLQETDEVLLTPVNGRIQYTVTVPAPGLYRLELMDFDQASRQLYRLGDEGIMVLCTGTPAQ